MEYHSNIFDRTFNMDDNHSLITIWKIYHKEEFVTKYNLFDTNIIYNLNIANTGYHYKNYHQLNTIFNEGVGIVFPYLNNLKSSIIGFQHYRRWYNSSLNDLHVNKIINGKIQVFQDRNVSHYDKFIKTYEYKALANHMYFWGALYNGFYVDIVEYLKENFPKYLTIEKNIHNMHGHSLFVCNWNKYCELAQLILGYLQFVANKYHFSAENENDWVNLIENNYINFNKKYHINGGHPSWNSKQTINFDNVIPYNNCESKLSYQYRIFGMIIEYIVSMFAHYHGFIFDQNNQIHFIKA